MAVPKISIVGAGLCGSLLGIFLARRGWDVQLFELRGDLRREPVEPGRSIKLTLAERGLAALSELGLAEHAKRHLWGAARPRGPVAPGRSIKLTLAERGLAALSELGLAEHVKRHICVPLRGRAVHSGTGTVVYQPYGKDDHEVIHSFSRNDLNGFLLDRAEAEPNLRIHVNHRCVGIEKETGAATFLDGRTGRESTVEADILIGSDGAFSAVRRMMMMRERVDFHQEFLPWGYKELTVDATAAGLER